jgi:hypothetical protein
MSDYPIDDVHHLLDTRRSLADDRPPPSTDRTFSVQGERWILVPNQRDINARRPFLYFGRSCGSEIWKFFHRIKMRASFLPIASRFLQEIH